MELTQKLWMEWDQKSLEIINEDPFGGPTLAIPDPC